MTVGAGGGGGGGGHGVIRRKTLDEYFGRSIFVIPPDSRRNGDEQLKLNGKFNRSKRRIRRVHFCAVTTGYFPVVNDGPKPNAS